MLNHSHHRPRGTTVMRFALPTRGRQHPEEPDVRPTSPVLVRRWKTGMSK
jgi:hypothetical protein